MGAMMSNAPTASVWGTPMPYIFGGLALIVALIPVTLITLACTNWCLWRRQQREKAEELAVYAPPQDLRPNYAVIVPGHDKPTCIATPVPLPVSDAV